MVFLTECTILCCAVLFRETHHVSGAAVKMAEDRGIALSSLSVADLQSIHPLFEDDVVKVGRALSSIGKDMGCPCRPVVVFIDPLC